MNFILDILKTWTHITVGIVFIFISGVSFYYIFNWYINLVEKIEDKRNQ